MSKTFKDRLREWEGPFDWINGSEIAADADAQLASKDAEIAALREDAERYRWMRDGFRMLAPNAEGMHLWIPRSAALGDLRGPTLDAAIDDARKKG